jgi:hypothetical protein
LESLSSGAAKGIANNLDEIYNKQGNMNNTEAMLSRVQAFLGQQTLGIDEQTRQELFEVFATSNWSSIEDLNSVATVWSKKLGENTAEMQTLF